MAVHWAETGRAETAVKSPSAIAAKRRRKAERAIPLI
jgi:hypothetical protein